MAFTIISDKEVMKIRYLFFVLCMYAGISISYAQVQDTNLLIHQLDSLRKIADAQINRLQLDSATFFVDSITEMTEHIFGRKHMQYALVVELRAFLEHKKGNYTHSEAYYKDGLQIRLEIQGRKYSDTAMAFNRLGNLYYEMGKYDEAEKNYLETKQILKDIFGESNLYVGWAASNLGRLYGRMGKMISAEKELLEGLRIKELNNSDEVDISHTLVYLGFVMRQTGKFDQGEQFTLRAANIWMNKFGPDNIFYYWAKNNLAEMYLYQGNQVLAKALIKEAISGKERLLSPTDLDVASSLNWLGSIYAAEGALDSAQAVLLRAKSIYEAHPGMQEHDLAYILHNLGKNALNLGSYEESESHLLSAMEIKNKLLGTENTDYMSSLILLSKVMIQTQRSSIAEAYLEKSKEFHTKNNLVYHDNYRYTLEYLYELAVINHEYEKATDYVIELLEINEFLTNNQVQFASENELLALSQRAEKILDLVFSLYRLRNDGNVDLIRELYNANLYYKGFILDRAIRIRSSTTADSLNRPILEQLQAYQRLALNEYLKPKDEREYLLELEFKRDSLEKELVRINSKYGNLRERIEWHEVSQILNTDDVAIEFIRYRHYEPSATDSIYYLALIQYPDQQDPVLVPLFEQKALQVIFDRWKTDRVGNINLAYDPAEYHPVEGPTLYDLIWKPIDKYLAGHKRIYYSSAGLLYKINLSAIADENNILIADNYEMVQLGSTSQLVEQNKRDETRNTVQLIGGLKYDLDTMIISCSLEEVSKISSTAGALMSFEDKEANSLRGKSWDYLYGSKAEIDSIQQIFTHQGMSSIVIEGYDGSEETFKNIGRSLHNPQSPDIIHISTHGYFFPDSQDEDAKPSFSAQESVFKSSNHPMIRSGLILAGGNYAWKYGHSYKPGMEDGILTAYEISQMDLSNTELVVLSACETGLGDIEGNEGVYGLQRAFKIAGVKNLIMSLWQVPDKATAILMASFYKHWLVDNMTIHKALHTAQKDMRDEGWDVYDWAGFVLVE